jgi:hypothetical protein
LGQAFLLEPLAQYIEINPQLAKRWMWAAEASTSAPMLLP